jgi:hypothetical protein
MLHHGPTHVGQVLQCVLPRFRPQTESSSRPKRSEVEGLLLPSMQQPLSMEALPSPLSSRAKPRDLRFPRPQANAVRKRRPPLCHPDRSVAKWRDLQFRRPPVEMFFEPQPPSETQIATAPFPFIHGFHSYSPQTSPSQPCSIPLPGVASLQAHSIALATAKAASVAPFRRSPQPFVRFREAQQGDMHINY